MHSHFLFAAKISIINKKNYKIIAKFELNKPKKKEGKTKQENQLKIIINDYIKSWTTITWKYPSYNINNN